MLGAQPLNLAHQQGNQVAESLQGLLHHRVIERIGLMVALKAARDICAVSLDRALADTQLLGNTPARHSATHEALYHPLARRQFGHRPYLFCTIPHIQRPRCSFVPVRPIAVSPVAEARSRAASRALGNAVTVAPRLEDGLLHEIISPFNIAAERNGRRLVGLATLPACHFEGPSRRSSSLFFFS
jgi:hypothetical protein